MFSCWFYKYTSEWYSLGRFKGGFKSLNSSLTTTCISLKLTHYLRMSFNWLIVWGESGIAGPGYKTPKTDFTNDYIDTAAHAVNESTYYFTL